jgi:hypothetical protein
VKLFPRDQIDFWAIFFVSMVIVGLCMATAIFA